MASVSVRALCLGERIDLRNLEGERVSPTATALRIGVDGCAIAFRHGSAVFFGVNGQEERELLNRLLPQVSDAFASPESEDATLVSAEANAEGPVDGKIGLSSFDIARYEVVADVLAKSVALARYEGHVAERFKQIEPLANRLRETGRTHRRAGALVQHIGDSLLMEHAVVGRIEVDEKPDILWERADLERLHTRLAEEYELRDRHRALERKLELVARTAQTLLDLLQNERSLRVEWYILVVILIELGIMTYELVSHFA